MIIPGSQKSNIMRLELDASKMWAVATSADGVKAAIKVNLKAGDALHFVDAIMHGSAARINPGQRRMALYRYGRPEDFSRITTVSVRVSEGRIRTETRTYIMSRKMSPEDFLKAGRNLWAIENKLHWILDVQMREDDIGIGRAAARRISRRSAVWS